MRIDSFREQPDDRLFGQIVGPFTGMRVADHPPLINQIECRPIPGPVAVPDGEIVVDDDRVLEAEPLHSILDIIEFPLPEKLWRVNPDHH